MRSFSLAPETWWELGCCCFFFPYVKLSRFLERVYISPHKIKLEIKWLRPGLFKGEISTCSHVCRMMILILTSPGRHGDSFGSERSREPLAKCVAGQDCRGGTSAVACPCALLCLCGLPPPVPLDLWLLVAFSQWEAPRETGQSRERQRLVWRAEP